MVPEDAMKIPPKIHFFETPAVMRAWLEKNHLKATGTRRPPSGGS